MSVSVLRAVRVGQMRVLRHGAGLRVASVLGLYLVMAGCAPSCEGCDSGAATSTGASTQAPPTGSADEPTNLAERRAASGADAQGKALQPTASPEQVLASALAGPTEAPALSPLQRVFPDAPEGKQRELLVLAMDRLRAPLSVATLRTHAELARSLPVSLGGARATAPAENGPTRVGDVPATVVSRTYVEGSRQVFVRVIDAGQAPTFRTPVIDQLAQQGSEQQGFVHGRLVNGYPTVALHYPSARSSRATAIVGNRYLVDIRVSEAMTAYDAQLVLAAMDLAQLAAPEVQRVAP